MGPYRLPWLSPRLPRGGSPTILIEQAKSWEDSPIGSLRSHFLHFTKGFQEKAITQLSQGRPLTLICRLRIMFPKRFPKAFNCYDRNPLFPRQALTPYLARDLQKPWNRLQNQADGSPIQGRVRSPRTKLPHGTG